MDITERKIADLEIHRQATELARANEDLLHFAYAVSHDLQAPLRNVTTFAQLLALGYEAKLDEEGVKIIDTIVEASARMGTMLRDLLQFAQVAGSDPRLDEPVSLEQTLTVVSKNLRSMIQDSGAIINHSPLPTLAGDSGQFVQLLQNLIGNSLKYPKPDTPPQIHISAQQDKGEWVIAICDNGIGFDAKHRDRIFGAFQRLHSTEFPGTGIGLTICKRIVERRGGRIWADSHPGEGATFSFSIPTGISQARREASSAAGMAKDSGRPPSPPVSEQTSADVDSEYLGELFKALDLAPAFVRKLDGTISIGTQGSERLFGWPKSEALGRGIQELLKAEFPIPLPEIEAELLRNGEWNGQLKKVRRDGSAGWVASHWTLYRDGAGRPNP
jgi:PAS domain S-box-containing protein